MAEAQQLVAIDLGSNSFHMVVARLADGQLSIIDRLRERVALAAGLDERNNITAEAQQRGLDCLRRFGERMPAGDEVRVRAVGTNTLRKARNAREFIAKAGAALGRPIEVIPGREEARLIYLGVSHSTGGNGGRRLVIDIGGGSTESIIGEGFVPTLAESLHMGCVSHTERFFGDGRLRREAFREATTAARVELETIEQKFRKTGWSAAIGSSGTILAIDTILRANGWGEGITRDGLRSLRDAMIVAGRVGKLSGIAGLSSERAPVLPGGFAILYAVFKSLKIDRMAPSTGALREGLLYDTLGRLAHEDVRERAIDWMSERYGVDRAQAARVEATALALFDRARAAWAIDDPEARLVLAWAARLHEVGLALSYSGYHRHGEYLVANSDMSGFSREQQSLLAALVGAHRRRLRPEYLAELKTYGGPAAIRLAVLLRLAATLNRARDPEATVVPEIVVTGNTVDLRFPKGWLDDHPMTATDLNYEQSFLSAAAMSVVAR
ncbi:MAG: Ppx/GppA family phosphatase [Myxococcales bacterium]|nr:Ppx/GppA family phosphatase [Myxococcales bacterium]